MAVTVTGTPVLRALPVGGEATSTLSVTVPSGAVKLVVCVENRRSPSRTVSGIAFNTSENLTQRITFPDGADDARTDIWDLDNPTATTANVVVTWSGAARGAVTALCLTGCVTGAPAATASGATNGVAVATTADGIVISSYGIDEGDTTTIALTAGSSIANHIGSTGAGSLSTRQGVATQAGTGGSVTTTWTPTGAGTIKVHAVAAYTATASGPTIDTQPTAGTCVLNNSTLTSKTFTVAATTSGGSLSYQWQKEDSVGAGTYSNITDGGIHSGATTTSLAVVPTSKATSNGIRYRCNVTDSNGTTTTTAVALTVYNGVILASATSVINGSGVATVTGTTDRPITANGAYVEFTATSASVVSRTSARPA